jgi:hypothetical protein
MSVCVVKRKVGRPLNPAPDLSARSVQLGTVISGSLKAALLDAAKASGRSLSAEVGYRLQRSLDNDGIVAAVDRLTRAMPEWLAKDKGLI